MGSYFADMPGGKRSYVLAFAGGVGLTSNYGSKKLDEVGAPPPGSYEAEIMGTGADVAFVPLGSSPAKRVARLVGYQPFAGKWGQTVDGMFFYRKILPATYGGR